MEPILQACFFDDDTLFGEKVSKGSKGLQMGGGGGGGNFKVAVELFCDWGKQNPE